MVRTYKLTLLSIITASAVLIQPGTLRIATNAFTVGPQITIPCYHGQTAQLQSKQKGISSLSNLVLSAAVVEDSPTETTKNTEKWTKEATELLEAFDRRSNKDDISFIVAQVAPSVRVAIPEEFGLDPGTVPTSKLVSALKALGFDLVLDTNTAADFTICEEGTELLHRIQAKLASNMNKEETFGAESEPILPLFTSCCPGWLNLVEKSAPEIAPYISSCKSPHMMYGAVLKEYSEELLGVPAEKVYFTSVMPCVRKRGESDQAVFVRRPGVRDVDNVITTRDLGQMLRAKGIDMMELEPMPFDSPFQNEDGAGTGAGQLFGVTGGVVEAAVRSVYELVTGSQLPRMELDEVRGLDGVKEAVIPLHDKEGNGLDLELRVAIVSGLGNAKTLIKKMKDGEAQYDFVEVMACPGGCINGGGQPKGGAVEKRLETIYALDRSLPIRRSHENPNVKKLYEDFLGEYGGHDAHRLLHVEPVYGQVPKPKKL